MVRQNNRDPCCMPSAEARISPQINVEEAKYAEYTKADNLGTNL